MTPPVSFRSWAQRWRHLGARDRRAMVWGGIVLVLALLWGVALGPAVATLREAPAQIAAERATLERIKAMAHEARALQPTTSSGSGSAMDRLREASDALAEQVQISTQGNLLVVNVSDVQPEALGAWLAGVRKTAHLKPSEASLRVSASGGWSGTVTFQVVDPVVEN